MNTTDSALRWGGIAVFVCYSIIIVAGGHGIAPMGLLLIFGAAPEWLPGMLFGWAGVVLECFAFRQVGKKRWKTYAWLAVSCFFVSAFFFVFASETLHYFGLVLGAFMVPFAAATTIRIRQIILRKEEEPNKAVEPTIMAVTDAAAQPPRQP